MDGREIRSKELEDWVRRATSASVSNHAQNLAVTVRPEPPTNRRQRRRQEYAELQRLYRKNQSRVARQVLEPPSEGAPSANADEMMSYLQRVQSRGEF